MKSTMTILCSIAFAGLFGCKKSSDVKTTDSLSAVEKLQEIIKTQPSYSNYVNLGLELAKAGRNAEAVTAYKKATEINPGAPLAWNNICAELNGQKKFAEAIENCEKAVSLEPKFTLAKNNLEFAQKMRAEQLKDIKKRKDQLQAKANAPAQEWINIGMELYHAREHREAITAWKRISRNDPLYALAMNNIASSYIILKELDKAESALREALRLEPKNQTFVNNKVWLEGERSKISK